jgi:hypothetical protein
MGRHLVSKSLYAQAVFSAGEYSFILRYHTTAARKKEPGKSSEKLSEMCRERY